MKEFKELLAVSLTLGLIVAFLIGLVVLGTNAAIEQARPYLGQTIRVQSNQESHRTFEFYVTSTGGDGFIFPARIDLYGILLVEQPDGLGWLGVSPELTLNWQNAANGKGESWILGDLYVQPREIGQPRIVIHVVNVQVK